jgi:hypothetical protein
MDPLAALHKTMVLRRNERILGVGSSGITSSALVRLGAITPGEFMTTSNSIYNHLSNFREALAKDNVILNGNCIMRAQTAPPAHYTEIR